MPCSAYKVSLDLGLESYLQWSNHGFVGAKHFHFDHPQAVLMLLLTNSNVKFKSILINKII